MCLLERKTARRGRSAVPRTFLRTRRCRRSLATWRLCMTTSSLRRLAGLAQHALVGVSDALALVGLGLADLADVGGDLAHELLVEASYGDAGGDGDLELHALGSIDRHRVGEPELEIEV